MPLLLQCHCGKKLKVRDELAGKKVKCPGCGHALTATAPEAEEPLDVLEMIEVDNTPATARAPAKSTPPPLWETKKDAEEEDEEKPEDKPTPYWVFGGALSDEVMALAKEGIYFASLKGDALKRAMKLLKNGERPANALGDKAIYIPWVWIRSIYSNKRLRGFTIYSNNGQEDSSKVLTAADCETRDEIFESLMTFLEDWEMTTRHHTPITATFAPMGCMGLVILLTSALVVISFFLAQEGEWEGAGRGWIVAQLLNLLRFMGPIWTSVVGFLVVVCIIIWLVCRIVAPPIEMTIKPKPPGEDD